MTLDKIFKTLGFGYLKDTVYNAGGLGIQEENYTDVIIAINATLNDLYLRFPLKFAQVIVEVTEGQNEYILDSRFAVSNTQSPEPDRWILDSNIKPFKDDISRIVEVYNNLFEMLPLNDSNDTMSVFTPEYNVIQIPDDMTKTGYQLALTYICSAPQIEVSNAIDLASTKIPLAQDFFNAIVLGTAVYMFVNNPSLQDAQAKQMYFNSLYEAECIKLVSAGKIPEDIPSSQLLVQNGWC